MKKLVVITIAMVLILGVGVWEGVFTNDSFKKIEGVGSELSALLVDEETASKNSEKIETLLSQMEESWYDFRKIALTLFNHTQIIGFSEKLITVRAFYEAQMIGDAYTALQTVVTSCRELARQNLPDFANLL